MAHRQAGRSRQLPSGADLSPQQLQAAYDRQLKQQSAVARLSQLALGVGADTLVERAVVEVCEGLGADSARVLDLLGDERQFRLRAAAGTQHRPEPNTTVYADARTCPGRAIRDDELCIVGDFDEEPDLERLPLFDTPGRLSALEAPIPSHERPLGVLGASSDTAFAFGAQDAVFVRTVANIIGEAIRREQCDEQLYRTMTTRQEALAMLSHDLRSPAAAIKLSLEVVRRAVVGDGEPIAPELVERAILKANANLDRMLGLLDDQLDADEREIEDLQSDDHD